MTRSIIRAGLLTISVGALAACGSGSGNPLSSSTTSSTSATSASTSGSGTAGSSGPIVVGSADFSESVVLAEVYAGALTAKGINATTKTNIGSREIYLKALGDGSIDLIPEYTGALAYFYDSSFSETDPDKVYAALQKLIPPTTELLAKSAAEDNDSINVTKATADKYHLKTLEDLAPVAKDLNFGAPPEFENRPQGIPGLKKDYGITFKSFRALKGQQLVQALKNGQIDAANVFSTDPSIAADGFVTLQDTKRLFGSQNVVPLIVKAKDTEQITTTLNAVSAALTTEKLAELVKQVDVDKLDPATVAKTFLTDNGLG